MTAEILVPLITIGLAELGDKTQLSVLLLSSRTNKRLHLLLGVMLAFLIVDGTAVLVGTYMTNIVPVDWLKTASTVVFIALGGWILVRGTGKEGKSRIIFKNSFLSGFTFIFLAEWGDKTQIASALFATQYNALMVLIGTMGALTLLSIMAVYLGRLISDRVDKKLMTRIAGTLFIIMGIVLLLL